MITKVSQLTCDRCGYGELLSIADVATARIEAQNSGWKFMAYPGLRVNGRNRARQVDACPKCILPTPEQLAAEMTSTQKQ